MRAAPFRPSNRLHDAAVQQYAAADPSGNRDAPDGPFSCASPVRFPNAPSVRIGVWRVTANNLLNVTTPVWQQRRPTRITSMPPSRSRSSESEGRLTHSMAKEPSFYLAMHILPGPGTLDQPPYQARDSSWHVPDHNRESSPKRSAQPGQKSVSEILPIALSLVLGHTIVPRQHAERGVLVALRPAGNRRQCVGHRIAKITGDTDRGRLPPSSSDPTPPVWLSSSYSALAE